jgi:hypothetical protein
MKEGYTNIPGTETPTRSVIDSAPAPFHHQARENPQIHRALLKPPTQEDREKHQAGVKYSEKHTAALAEEAPKEREERIKRQEALQKKWDHGATPEGTREFAALLVRQAKNRGVLPPDIDHLWLNFPSGWAEYREVPAGVPGEKPSYTVALDQTPTKEQWDEYYPALQEKLQAWQEEKAKRVHAGDPRYDPMTGDLLKPDELPLSPTSEYLITGKTRPRRFVPPGSPHLKEYKPLQTNEEDNQPETEKNERHIRRLLKAGWTEVAPVGDDWQYFAFCERLRNMSPAEIAQEWQEIQREMKQGTQDYDPAKDWLLLLCKMLKDAMMALINEQIEEGERKKK